MPWIKFTADFDFKPKPSVTLAYLAGQTRLVTTTCARKAKSAGRAVSATKPKGASNG